ncbi:response regulator transcription factor [Lacibacter luteus]|uniref:Response regulator transcription factor n=1 Tax=Lacibacter luteus TaxID=2508719 RepID=A0A4Q1CNF3_9BACT|nr:LytTR family DNA-binding domain-containing protein [Lacibacter luteus]RXK62231.1 response regulator transcription factor [Lacibacter luteus]
MLKVLTVDDEPKNLRIIKELLKEYCPQAEHVGEADNIDTAYDLIRELKPDLVLLDIEMPHGNAFDLLDKIMPVNFEIVFVTAFDSYSLKAFKYSALDYLLKPVDINELKAVVAKAELKAGQKNINEQLRFLMQNIKQPTGGLQKIAVPTFKDQLDFVDFQAILYCEASGAYTYIFTVDGQKLISSKSLKEYEDILPEDSFFRLHHSYLINLNKVKKYHKGRGGEVEMENGTFLEVATRRKDDFMKRIGY